MRPKRFGKVLPVRLPESVNSRLILIAVTAGITKSDALRMAVANGLQDLENGKINLGKLSAVEAA